MHGWRLRENNGAGDRGGWCWWEQQQAAVDLPARLETRSCAKTVRPRQANGGESDLVINNETGKFSVIHRNGSIQIHCRTVLIGTMSRRAQLKRTLSKVPHTIAFEQTASPLTPPDRNPSGTAASLQGILSDTHHNGTCLPHSCHAGLQEKPVWCI